MDETVPDEVVHDAKATFALRGKTDSVLRAMELVGFYVAANNHQGTAREAVAAMRADLDALAATQDAFTHLLEHAGV